MAVCLLTMLFVAFYQVLLRNFYDFSYLWADQLVRILVLWVGLLGASIATHQSQHLSIDVVTKFLPARVSQVVKLLVRIFAVVVCILLARASWSYMVLQMEMGEKSLFGLPAWSTETIIPGAFILISFHFLIHIIQGMGELLFGVAAPKTPEEPI